MVTRLLLWIALLASALPALAQTPAALSAFVDRTDISINDVVTLTIRVDASLGSLPSTAGLNREFEQVGGVATRSTYTNNGGTIQSWTEHSIMLRPRATGVLTIPAFRVGPEVSNPIRINVGEATDTSGTGASDEIFLVSTVSKDELYVQEQLLYIIKIYYAIGFDQGAQLTSPQVADAVVQQLGSDSNYQEVVNGIGYNVTERRFVIFPQSSGQLTIPPVYFNASVGRRSGINRFFNNRATMREINLSSDVHQLTVLPRPSSFPGQTWLPAAQLTLEETWSTELDNIEVGDAVTRNVVLTTEGLSSSLLPAIIYEQQDGLKFYPDQPVREDASDSNGVIGKRSEGTAIVASQPGQYVLPEVRLPWWNTQTNALETALLPARTLTVVAPPGTSSVPTLNTGVDFVTLPGQPPAPSAVNPASQTSGIYLFWISATAVFASAWLFSTLMWMRSRRQLSYAEVVQPQQLRAAAERQAASSAVRSPDATACLKVLQTACSAGNLHDIRKAVLAWGRSAFADPTILTLDQLALRCQHARISALLQTLDEALYGNGSAQFDSRELYTEVAALHKHGVPQMQGEDRYGLPPLYKD